MRPILYAATLALLESALRAGPLQSKIMSVDDIGKVAAIIDAAMKVAANTSNLVSLDVKDRKTLDDKVLADAIEDAPHNAEVMATAEGAGAGEDFGQRLGRVCFGIADQRRAST